MKLRRLFCRCIWDIDYYRMLKVYHGSWSLVPYCLPLNSILTMAIFVWLGWYIGTLLKGAT